MKCEVLFVRFNQIDPDSPERLVLHQFTHQRNFTVEVPLFIGFELTAPNFISMVKLAKNKRANIKLAEFFLHQDFSLPNSLQYKNFLLVNYDNSKQTF